MKGWVAVFNIDNTPLRGKVVSISLPTPTKDVNNKIIQGVISSATDNLGTAYFHLIPNFCLLDNPLYVLQIEGQYITSFQVPIEENLSLCNQYPSADEPQVNLLGTAIGTITTKLVEITLKDIAGMPIRSVVSIYLNKPSIDVERRVVMGAIAKQSNTSGKVSFNLIPNDQMSNSTYLLHCLDKTYPFQITSNLPEPIKLVIYI